MNYIQRAKIAQKILTAAGNADVVAVTLYGYEDCINIQTVGPLDGYEYAPRHKGGHPCVQFEQEGFPVHLTYVPDEEVTP